MRRFIDVVLENFPPIGGGNEATKLTSRFEEAITRAGGRVASRKIQRTVSDDSEYRIRVYFTYPGPDTVPVDMLGSHVDTDNMSQSFQVVRKDGITSGGRNTFINLNQDGAAVIKRKLIELAGSEFGSNYDISSLLGRKWGR